MKLTEDRVTDVLARFRWKNPDYGSYALFRAQLHDLSDMRRGVEGHGFYPTQIRKNPEARCDVSQQRVKVSEASFRLFG